MAKCVHRVARATLVAGAVLAACPNLLASPIIDPALDLRTFDPNNPASYAGPANLALDVLSAEVILDGINQTLTFTSTMNGPLSSLINPVTGANEGLMAWGINHGYGNLNFSQLGLPGIVFDAVLSLNANGTGTYRGAATPAGAITISGNTLTAVLPISFLAPPPQPGNAQGPLLPVELWAYNLWPRSTIRADGTPLGFGDSQIADFAPDATTFRATITPEPSSIVLLTTGLLGVARSRHRLRCRLHRPRAASSTEHIEFTPTTRSVKTQKNAPSELAAIRPPTNPTPRM
jgi:PEP-CTERM motif